MQRWMYRVDVEVEGADGSRQTMRFNLLASSEHDARNQARKSAQCMGKGLVRGGLFVRPAASTRGGNPT